MTYETKMKICLGVYVVGVLMSLVGSACGKSKAEKKCDATGGVYKYDICIVPSTCFTVMMVGKSTITVPFPCNHSVPCNTRCEYPPGQVEVTQ